MDSSLVRTFLRYGFLLALLSGSVPASAVTIPPTRSFVRTDMPPHAMVADPAHKVVYASVPGLNQVDVISTATHTITARIPVPRAFGMDISPDGTQLVVGSGSTLLGDYSSQYLTLIDTATLQITNRVLLPKVQGLSLPTGEGLAPASPVWASNGTVLVIVRDQGSSYGDLVQWDPAKNSFVYRFNQSSGYSDLVARSGDYSKVLIQTSVYGLCLYDAASDAFVASTAATEGTAAVNFDGTQFAVTSVNAFTIYNSSLSPVTTIQATGLAQNGFYSRDGKYLYIPETLSFTSAVGAYVVYDTTSFLPQGVMPAFNVTTGAQRLTTIEGVDDRNEFFGALDRGVAFYSFPIVNSPTQPSLAFGGPVQPSGGTLASPATSTIAGLGLGAGDSVFFGNQAASTRLWLRAI